MKKVAIIGLGFLAVVMIGFAIFGSLPQSDAIFVHIWIIEDGFTVDYADADYGGTFQSINITGNRINREGKNHIKSPVLEELAFMYIKVGEYPTGERQKECVRVGNMVTSTKNVVAVFQGFDVPIVIANEKIYHLSLVDCRASGLEAYGVTRLHMTRCNDMEWSKLANYKKLSKIHIAPGAVYDAKELKTEGFFPEDFSVIETHATLQTLSLHIYAPHEEFPDVQEFTLTKNDLSGFDAIKDYVPFTLEEAQAFLTSDDKSIWVLLDGFWE